MKVELDLYEKSDLNLLVSELYSSQRKKISKKLLRLDVKKALREIHETSISSK